MSRFLPGGFAFMVFQGRRGLVAAVLLGSLGACSRVAPTATGALALQLSEAEETWRAAALRDYTFLADVSCFCVPDYTGSLAVTVRNGAVVSVRDPLTGANRPISYRQPVDSLFALIRREIASNPSKLEVSYDQPLGYPRRIRYGNMELDAGAVLTVDNLKRTP